MANDSTLIPLGSQPLTVKLVLMVRGRRWDFVLLGGEVCCWVWLEGLVVLVVGEDEV